MSQILDFLLLFFNFLYGFCFIIFLAVKMNNQLNASSASEKSWLLELLKCSEPLGFIPIKITNQLKSLNYFNDY